MIHVVKIDILTCHKEIGTAFVPQSTDTQDIFSTRYSVMCKVFTGYCGTSEIEHDLCACTVDNHLAKARGLSLRIGAQTMLYLSLILKVIFHFTFIEKKTIKNMHFLKTCTDNYKSIV